MQLHTGVHPHICGAPTSPPALAADDRAEHREGRTDQGGPCASVAAAAPVTHVSQELAVASAVEGRGHQVVHLPASG
ncbi:hypothetical protein OG758_45990 [Streptomyces sp. NBC_01474]|uniref:hypothetical protein n=1 Tax=Streptomyces sp. NBC_01474 TaxID=2903880 RepID=UPI002DDB35F7|nr:hypothetical protein [Streptomyces sp. NBC_01474]WSE00875.1 hypothetical protein OG758_45990 [Streptomyces sp. NBC_01474]